MCTFIFTGVAHVDGEHYDRALLTEIAESKGHHVVTKVTSFTNILVTDEWPPKKMTKKARAALDYKVEVITPEQFLEKMRAE